MPEFLPSAGIILIVEDESAIADSITCALRTDGFTLGGRAPAAGAVEPGSGTGRARYRPVRLERAGSVPPAAPVQRRAGVLFEPRSDEIDRIVGLEIGAPITSASRFRRANWWRASG